MTTPTDDPKVKELLEAVREFCSRQWTFKELKVFTDMQSALAALDHPKPKQYPPMPEWLEFAMTNRVAIERAVEQNKIFGLSWPAFNAAYNAIREATAKD